MAVFAVQAEEYSYTFSAKQFTANSSKDLGGVSWTLAGDGGYWGYDGTKGHQFGSGNIPYKTLTLSTSGIEGTVKKIVLNTSGASSVNATAKITVGGESFGSQIKLTSSATNYTFEGSAEGDIVISYSQTSSKAIYIKSISVTYETGEVSIPTLETPVISPESCNFNEGETLSVTIAAEEGATIYYTTDGSEPTDESSVYGGAISITKSTVVKAFAAKEGCNDSKIVTEEYTMIAEGEIVDVLTRETTGVKSGSTNYSAWTGKTATSSAVYAGNSAGSNDAIQLRSTNSNSGVVTTTSGGKAKKIVVEWQSSTTSGRILQVYGKNSAYAAATDLYSSSTQGTKLGEIKCGTSTELTINGDYEYIGLRSSSGAMYLTSVEITWEAKKTESFKLNVTSAGWATLYLPKAVVIPTNVKCYAVESVKDGYALLAQIEGVLPAQTAVLVEAPANNYALEVADEANEYNGVNKLCGTLMNQYVNEEAYVLSAPEGKVGLYKAAMNGGVWLNNANKAYLPVSAIPDSAQGAASYSFSFDWAGTTAIENIEVKNPMADGAIYDLTGRKINSIAVTGIYIINGKKVFVRK